jgi:hypothetical protein
MRFAVPEPKLLKKPAPPNQCEILEVEGNRHSPPESR